MTEVPSETRTAVIIEDDPGLRHLLSEVLEAAGFSTVSVGNGIDGIRAVLSYKPMITTLDVNMPGMDGIEAARRIREQSETHIIMISGLGDEADIVMGLTAGADEYLIKPFRPREFRARVEALMRRPRATLAVQPPSIRTQETAGPSFPTPRTAPTAPPAPTRPAAPVANENAEWVIAEDSSDAVWEGDESPAADANGAHLAEGDWLTHRNLQLDVDSRIVLIDNREIDLTRTEFDLLAALLHSRRRVRSKADLTLLLRGESYVTSYFVGDADKRAIEAHMTNLRRKIGDSPTQPRYIETVRGVGYRLTAEQASPQRDGQLGA
ncbi:response regulator transcription factor [Microbacterium sp. R86528]|uniref:response regulator transcription factor n=1 Tax=Microbacterium sp. R86528 TaxID=3093864 RepID=UPI0037C648B6